MWIEWCWCEGEGEGEGPWEEEESGEGGRSVVERLIGGTVCFGCFFLCIRGFFFTFSPKVPSIALCCEYFHQLTTAFNTVLSSSLDANFVPCDVLYLMSLGRSSP